MKIIPTIILLFFLSGYRVLASKITSIVCGEWSSQATWDLNRLPNAYDTVVINSFVRFDMDFASKSPGLLYVSACGTLCGAQSYTGCFAFYGIIFVKTITLNYGHSVSNATINVLSIMTLINGASASISNSQMNVGRSSLCLNCNSNTKSIPCSPVGLANITINDGPRIYPNPVLNELNISGIEPKTLIEIYNITGNLILRTTAESDLTLNLQDYHPGLYFLVANTSKKTTVNKVVISR